MQGPWEAASAGLWPAHGPTMPSYLAHAAKDNQGTGPLILFWPPEEAVSLVSGFWFCFIFWFFMGLLGVILNKKTFPPKLT